MQTAGFRGIQAESAKSKSWHQVLVNKYFGGLKKNVKIDRLILKPTKIVIL